MVQDSERANWAYGDAVTLMRKTAQYIEESGERDRYSSLKAPKNKFDGRGKHGNPNSLKNLVAPWPKGMSGNPGGEPGYDVAAKVARQVVELNQEQIYRGMAAEVIAGKPYAFDVLANRAYGKVKETVDVNVSGRIELATAIEERRKKKSIENGSEQE